jgi:hypothetical protein
MAGFEPIPVALALYLLFTVGRLVAASKRKISNGVLLASIVMDISLLMFLIWTFHIQYQQPPSFYQKAPTMLYAFLFIALRALRFDPKYVLSTGVVAVTGWIVLIAYVFSDEHDSMITRNYVDYMTSNAILIGAEIDKIVSIIVVIEVLAVVITLHSACSIKQFWTVLWRTIFRGLFRMRLQTELLNQTVVFNQAKGKAVLQQLYLQIYKASQRFRKSYRPKT